MKATRLVAAACFALAAQAFAAPPQARLVPEGEAIPDQPLYGLFHDYRKFSDFQGKPLIINVWASWCAPCRAEMGSLDRIAKRHNGKQFHIIGISTDDYPGKATDYLVRAAVSFDNYIDKNLLWETMLGAERIPLTVLIDAKGRVVKRVYGAKAWDSPEMVAVIEKSLGVKLR
ncbi:MAG: TlpA family protein disulfide reductase [Betaproteobacteria bacterium]|nr:TlpA family protein disulfide reductase [Betaproteobacteria bacterium]